MCSLAYRAGVSVGVTSPARDGILGGISTAFGLGSAHKLEDGAMVQEAVAVHTTIGHSVASGSVSTQVAALRRLLLGPPAGDVGRWFEDVADVRLRLYLYFHETCADSVKGESDTCCKC